MKSRSESKQCVKNKHLETKQNVQKQQRHTLLLTRIKTSRKPLMKTLKARLVPRSRKKSEDSSILMILDQYGNPEKMALFPFFS